MMQNQNTQRVSTGAAPPQATVVYGIPLPPTASDVEVKLVRTVMRLSAFMAIIAVIQQLYLVIVQKFHMQSLLSVLVSLLVPACGWYGAKERNKFFLQTFSCMNWCNALVFGIEFIGELLMFDAEYHSVLSVEMRPESKCHETCVMESRLQKTESSTYTIAINTEMARGWYLCWRCVSGSYCSIRTTAYYHLVYRTWTCLYRNECTLVRTIMLQPNNNIYKWFHKITMPTVVSYTHSNNHRCHVW